MYEAIRKCSYALRRILPHEGCGGCTPKPSQLNPASIKMALAMPNVTVTSTGASEFGSK